MSRSMSAIGLSVCLIVSIAASAKSQEQPHARGQGIILEINVLELTGARSDDIEKMETGKDQINRLIVDGKARQLVSFQLRTRTGEPFSARIGDRIPIQTATWPVLRTTDRTSRDTREPLPSQATSVAIPQIAYENTGVIVEGVATAAGEGLLDIRLKVEMTSVDRVTGSLTPTFTQRNFTNVVRMKESETSLLMGFSKQAVGRQLTIEEIASGTTNAPTGGFVVLLTTKAGR